MNTDEPKNSNPLVRPRDQPAVAVLAASALVLLAAIWWRQGGHRAGVVDIDRAPALTAKFQVNVNTAQWPELIQLPGVGPTLAQRLVAERQDHGAYRDADDLRRVRGIGPRTLEQIKPYLLPIPQDANVAQR